MRPPLVDLNDAMLQQALRGEDVALDAESERRPTRGEDRSVERWHQFGIAAIEKYMDAIPDRIEGWGRLLDHAGWRVNLTDQVIAQQQAQFARARARLSYTADATDADMSRENEGALRLVNRLEYIWMAVEAPHLLPTDEDRAAVAAAIPNEETRVLLRQLWLQPLQAGISHGVAGDRVSYDTASIKRLGDTGILERLFNAEDPLLVAQIVRATEHIPNPVEATANRESDIDYALTEANEQGLPGEIEAALGGDPFLGGVTVLRNTPVGYRVALQNRLAAAHVEGAYARYQAVRDRMWPTTYMEGLRSEVRVRPIEEYQDSPITGGSLSDEIGRGHPDPARRAFGHVGDLVQILDRASRALQAGPAENMSVSQQAQAAREVARGGQGEVDEDEAGLTSIERRVPDAPYKKGTWEELVFKRALRYAIEGGFDAIAWTPGRVQVDRYSSRLRQRFDRLTWKRGDGGMVAIEGYKNDRPVMSEPITLPESRLVEAVGVRMAREIRESTESEGEFSGQRITFDSPGMYDAYDRRYPTKWNKLVSPFTKKGKNVASLTLDVSTGTRLRYVGPEPDVSSVGLTPVPNDDAVAARDDVVFLMGQGYTFAQAMDRTIDDRGWEPRRRLGHLAALAQEAGGEIVEAPDVTDVQAVPVTESMRGSLTEAMMPWIGPLETAKLREQEKTRLTAVAKERLTKLKATVSGLASANCAGVDPTVAAKLVEGLVSWGAAEIKLYFATNKKWPSLNYVQDIFNKFLKSHHKHLRATRQEMERWVALALQRAKIETWRDTPLEGKRYEGRDLPEARGMELPEMLRFVKHLVGETMLPTIRRRLRGKKKEADFEANGHIKLVASLFEAGDPVALAKVLGRQIGHLVDWMEEGDLGRGNLIGRLAGFHKFLEHTFTVKDNGTRVLKNKTFREELIAFSQAWRPEAWAEGTTPAQENYLKSARSLFADAISGVLVSPETVQALAPEFYKAFFTLLPRSKPEVAEEFLKVYALLHGAREEQLDALIQDMADQFHTAHFRIEEAQKILKAQLRAMRLDWRTWIGAALIDVNTAMIQRIKKVKKELGPLFPEDMDIRHIFSKRNYIGSLTTSFADDYFKPIYRRLMESKINSLGPESNLTNVTAWDVFGIVLALDRIRLGDRQTIANPGGLDVARADEEYHHLLKKLTPEDQVLLNEEIGKFREAVRDIAERAHKAGLYSDETYQQMLDNPAYATFQTLEHITEPIDAKVYEQIGTFKDIANTADSTILKTLVTLQALERNKVKTAGLTFLRTYFNNRPGLEDEVQDAPTHLTFGEGTVDAEGKEVRGKPTRVYSEPRTPLDKAKWGLVKYLEDGKVKGVWVPKYVAQSLNNDDIGHTNAVVKVLERMNSYWFRPVFTTINVGFQGYNLARDFFRFWKAMSHRGTRGRAWYGERRRSITLFKAFRLYLGATTAARLRAYGLPDKPSKRQQAVWAKLKDSYTGQILAQTMRQQAMGFEAQRQLDKDIARGSAVDDDPVAQRHLRQKLEEQEESLLGQSGVQSPSKKKRSLIPRAVLGLIESIGQLGDFVETLPKAAAINHFTVDRKVSDLTESERAFIRERVGSPDFLAGGTYKPITNNLFLFSNAILQGWRSDIKTALDAETSAGYLWKTVRVTVLPKLIMAGAAAGMFGPKDEDDEDPDWYDVAMSGAIGAVAGGLPGAAIGLAAGAWDSSREESAVSDYRSQMAKYMQMIPEYDKLNFTVVPLGIVEGGQLAYLRIPQDDTGRVIGALSWNLFKAAIADDDPDWIATFQAILDYTAGQVPGTVPAFDALKDSFELASGKNPELEFYDRSMFTEDEMTSLTGGQKWKQLALYELRNLGLAQVAGRYQSSRPRARGKAQTLLEAPLIYNILGRWVRFTSAGVTQSAVEFGREESAGDTKRRHAWQEQAREIANDVLKETPAEGVGLEWARQVFAGRVAADPMPSISEAQNKITIAAGEARAALKENDPNFADLSNSEMEDIQDDISTRALRDFMEGGGGGAQWEAWITGFRYAGTIGRGAQSQGAWLYNQRGQLNPEQFDGLYGVLKRFKLVNENTDKVYKDLLAMEGRN